MKRAALVISVSILLAACGGSSGPEGVDQAVWDQYCRHGGDLTSALRDAQNGVVTDSELVDELDAVQSNMRDDALGAGQSSASMGHKIRAVSDSVGRAKVGISDGTETLGDAANEIVVAVADMPDC